VQAVAQANGTQVQACLDQARASSPDVHGQVVVYANVDPSGAATSASVARSTANDSLLESCLLGAFRSWTFPAPTGGGAAVISHTFTFP
jgi:TonB family protein